MGMRIVYSCLMSMIWLFSGRTCSIFGYLHMPCRRSKFNIDDEGSQETLSPMDDPSVIGGYCEKRGQFFLGIWPYFNCPCPSEWVHIQEPMYSTYLKLQRSEILPSNLNLTKYFQSVRPHPVWNLLLLFLLNWLLIKLSFKYLYLYLKVRVVAYLHSSPQKLPV